jgi:hypothetical protein
MGIMVGEEGHFKQDLNFFIEYKGGGGEVISNRILIILMGTSVTPGQRCPHISIVGNPVLPVSLNSGLLGCAM